MLPEHRVILLHDQSSTIENQEINSDAILLPSLKLSFLSFFNSKLSIIEEGSESKF